MIIVKRVQWGAEPPRPGVQTVAMSRRTEFMVHHSGGAPDQTVRAIQQWCMGAPPHGRGFKDIDYNFLVRGTTGEVYEGRGWDAVGSHCVGHNTNALGVCIIGHDDLTPAAKEAVRMLYQEAVRRAGHALTVLGHRDAARTECPGTTIYAWLQANGVRGLGEGFRDLRLTTPPMQGGDVRTVQVIVGATPDGIYGPATDARVRIWQRDHGLVDDGIVGPRTRAAMGILR